MLYVFHAPQVEPQAAEYAAGILSRLHYINNNGLSYNFCCRMQRPVPEGLRQSLAGIRRCALTATSAVFNLIAALRQFRTWHHSSSSSCIKQLVRAKRGGTGSPKTSHHE